MLVSVNENTLARIGLVGLEKRLKPFVVKCKRLKRENLEVEHNDPTAWLPTSKHILSMAL